MKTIHLYLFTLILTYVFSATLYSQRTKVAYQVGGLDADDIVDIDYDDEGNLYVTGIFRGTVDFDPYGLIGTGDERTSNGESDIFIQKYGVNNLFLSPIDWTITIGGTGNDIVSSISVSNGPDPQIYIGGQYENTVDFDPDPTNTVQYPAVDQKDAFVAGYDADGKFEEFVYMPGNSNENVTDLQMVGDSLVYIVGEFYVDISFDPVEGTYENSNGNNDIFVAKYKPSTNNYLWNYTIGGTGIDELNCLDIDDSNSLYFGGGFSETVDFDPSASDHSIISTGGQDAFVSCFDPEGNFQWVEKLGNSESNQTTALTIAGDTIWSASYFYDDIGFQVGFVGGFPILKSYSSNGSKDILLQKHLTNGTNLTSDWRHIGGALVDQVNDMDYDSRNKLIITGFFSGNNFDLDPDDIHEDLFHSSGAYDLFIAKLNGSYEYIWGNTISNPYSIVPRALTLKKNDDIRIAGSFSSEIDFNPWGPAPLSKTSKGFTDGFIINIKPYSDSCEILSFTLSDQTGPASIDDTHFAIDIEVEYGTDLTLLSPTIDISGGATIDPASGQSQDFSDTVMYTVTAENGATQQEWAVIVSEAEATGIDHKDGSFITIYPNPANEKIYVGNLRNENITIELHGINGHNYLRKISHGSQTVIDVSAVPAGLYILKVCTSDKTITRKWVITE